MFNTASGSWVGAVATVPVSEATVTGVKSFMAGYTLIIGGDTVAVVAVTGERQCKDYGRQLIWLTRLVQLRGNVRGRGSGGHT